ncbi:hypothetical protein LUX12_10630 [Streptomyces somaliensis]|uniref:hypothetical protein n=1 Tax=Streptomyces somaliensis TaxID=78355 RepID=UPI0020CFCE40|nr:hypothetical protein [Streptomyces somaliensis]MCP9945128.1 hypothetical protein [Streptomyces somaliensis]MCP9961648.1 hypothetical protein [Streptomyces somaliensis]MCP9974466.1 hypothetical protein [Streptomyces somaliensis]
MTVILIPILLSLLVGVWFWSQSLFSGTWRHSPAWFAWSALFLLLGAGVTYLVGSLAGASLDPEEACHRAGEAYDQAYRRANFEEYTRWFPLRNKCHADYDLVPTWVNPALVTLTVLALACTAYAAHLAVLRRRTKKKGTS